MPSGRLEAVTYERLYYESPVQQRSIREALVEDHGGLWPRNHALCFRARVQLRNHKLRTRKWYPSFL